MYSLYLGQDEWFTLLLDLESDLVAKTWAQNKKQKNFLAAVLHGNDGWTFQQYDLAFFKFSECFVWDVELRRVFWFNGKSLRSSASYKRLVWGAVRKNIISDRFSTKTAISAHI